MNVESGERVGLGMTALLTIFAINIIASSFLPITGEQLWLTSLTFICVSWTGLSLLETYFVIYFHYKKGLMKVRSPMPWSCFFGKLTSFNLYRYPN